MTNEKYMDRKEVREQLEGLIRATDYTDFCLNCVSEERRLQNREEYFGVLIELNNLGVTREEINSYRLDARFGTNNLSGCIGKDDLFYVVADILNKKGLLKKVQGE